MKNRPAVCAHGFSLLEVLITTILLVLGVVAVVKALADGTAIDLSVESRAIATQLAQEQIEIEKNIVPFSNIVTSGRSDIDGFSGYQREILVSGSDPKNVAVTVYWSTNGVEDSLTLQTLIANLIPGS